MDTDQPMEEARSKLRPYSDDHLLEDLNRLNAEVAGLSQSFGLLPDDKVIEDKPTQEFMGTASRFAAITEIFVERGL